MRGTWGVILLFFILRVEAKVLVAYPITKGASHRAFYADIVQGITQRLGSVKVIQIEEATTSEHILKEVGDSDGIILLGAKGLNLAMALKESRLPIIVGSTNVSPDTTPGLSGVSIFTRLEPLLDFTRRLLPDYRIIYYVENQAERWYINTVKEAARKFSFTLETHSTTTPAEAWQVFLAGISKLSGKNGLILLPMSFKAMDPDTYEEDLVWRLLNRRIPVISNLFRYAQAEVLVGSYPDPIPYGRQIAEMLLARLAAKADWTPKVELARDVRITYSTRFGVRMRIQLPETMRHEVFEVF